MAEKKGAGRQREIKCKHKVNFPQYASTSLCLAGLHTGKVVVEKLESGPSDGIHEFWGNFLKDCIGKKVIMNLSSIFSVTTY